MGLYGDGMKRITLLALTFFFLVGCAGVPANTKTPNETYTGTYTEPENSVTTSVIREYKVDANREALITPDKTNTYISPPKVEIGNYFPGAPAVSIETSIHNGGQESQSWKVTNTVNDPSFTVRLDKTLMDATIEVKTPRRDANNRVMFDLVTNAPLFLSAFFEHGVFAVNSTLQNETLRVVGYNAATNELDITGLINPPTGTEVTRTVQVIYQTSDSQRFLIAYQAPTNLQEGIAPAPEMARLWVTIDVGTVVIKPWDTAKIPVTLSIPANATDIPPKWEFRILVGADIPGVNTVRTQFAARWIVAMNP